MKYKLFLILCLFYSCTSRQTIIEPPSEFQLSEFFIKDIPLTAKGNPSPIVEEVNQWQDYLLLPTISSGVDSIEIRIWLVYTNDNIGQLIQLKNEKAIWSGNVYNYHLSDLKDDLHIDEIKPTSISPKNGWVKLITSLNNYSIGKLPNYNALPNYIDATHANLTIFEIATQQFYRMYYYPMPGFNLKFPETRNVLNILKVIENETNFIKTGNL